MAGAGGEVGLVTAQNVRHSIAQRLPAPGDVTIRGQPGGVSQRSTQYCTPYGSSS